MKKVTVTAGQSTSTIMVNRPPWNKVYGGYPKTNAGTASEGDLLNTEVFTQVFGVDYDPVTYHNACGTRTSLALLAGGMGGVGERGIKITNKSNIYYGKTIEPGAGNLKTFLEKKWGKADEIIKFPKTVDDVSKRLNNKKGIYIMIPTRPSDFGGATGHATLWTGNRVMGDNYCIDEHTYAIYFWELK
ncbi:hypothetical protein CHU32_27720 [Superficieibacter electus]|uniref:Uncharacterized protein n=1 Tax=Superficieibacter electus TaxID=2022662 RepID=A0A2P5GGK2_9ENTR|nr:T6SS effector amidase Tae4 family protein [Superficieibacter electus]POP40381.1 hypothetical protein CHU33_27665 [Superficieibacter electus]POP40697.1 hypothetical protein CHU32_27720 [Superficieibacter electus]